MYRELAQSLDTVIHNGALVNHAFTYEQLFEPNVLGSLEVQHLASSCIWRDTGFMRPGTATGSSSRASAQDELQHVSSLACTFSLIASLEGQQEEEGAPFIAPYALWIWSLYKDGLRRLWSLQEMMLPKRHSHNN